MTRFVALWMAGLALLVGQNWKRLEGMVRMQQVTLVLILVLGTLSFQRNRIWGDELSLWQDAAAGSPEMPRVHVHLGNALRERGDWVEARDEYQAALRLERLAEDAVTEDSRLRASILGQAGHAWTAADDLTRAYAALTPALELNKLTFGNLVRLPISFAVQDSGESCLKVSPLLDG